MTKPIGFLSFKKITRKEKNLANKSPSASELGKGIIIILGMIVIKYPFCQWAGCMLSLKLFFMLVSSL